MTNRVLEILKQKFHPNEYEAEQKAKQETADKLHAERLEFIKNFKSLLKSKEQDAVNKVELDSTTKRPLFKDQSTKAQEQIIAGGLRQFFD